MVLYDQSVVFIDKSLVFSDKSVTVVFAFIRLWSLLTCKFVVFVDQPVVWGIY